MYLLYFVQFNCTGWSAGGVLVSYRLQAYGHVISEALNFLSIVFDGAQHLL